MSKKIMGLHGSLSSKTDSVPAGSTYKKFVEEFPGIGEAWDVLRECEKEDGLIDERVHRMIKLGIAIGAGREGAVHSAVRKALKAGVTKEEIDRVLTMAASTVGFPATVAAYTWIRDSLHGKKRKK